MKSKKFAVIFCIIILALSLSAELGQEYLDNYSSIFYRATVNRSENYSDSEIIECIENNKSSDLKYYIPIVTEKTEYSETERYYFSDNCRQAFERVTGIKEGTYKSLFSGEKTLEYENIKDYKSINSYITVYFIGNREDIVSLVDSMNTQLSAQIELGLPKNDIHTNEKTVTIWSIAAVVIFLLTGYETIIKKKEVTLKAINGERLTKILIRQMSEETAALCCIFGISYVLIKLFYKNTIDIKCSVICFTVVVLINNLLYLPLMRTNIKKDLATAANGKPIIIIGYAVKVTMLTTALLLSALCIKSISQSMYIIKMKPIYSNMNNSWFLKIESDELNEGDVVEGIEAVNKDQNKVLIGEFDAAKPVLLTKSGMIYDIPVVWANTNAKKYIENDFPKITETKSKILILYPEKERKASEIIKKSAENRVPFDVEVSAYKGNKTINTISSSFEKDEMNFENPILVYFNLNAAEYAELTDNNSDFFLTVYSQIVFSFDKNQINTIYEKYGINSREVQITNVSDEYNRRLDHEKMNAVITAMFAILIIIFEASVTEYIISMDFAINGKEYIVRRINGCRYANVFEKLIIENTAMSLLSIGLYTAIIKAEDIGFYRIESVTSAAIIILTEIVVITVSINKFKKEATNKILKGGLL